MCLWVSCSVVFLATLWTVACQAPLSMKFSRQEYWSGLPFPSPIGGSTSLQTQISGHGLWVTSQLFHNQLCPMLSKAGGKRRISGQSTQFNAFQHLMGTYYVPGTMLSVLQFSSVTQLCPTLCNPMDCSIPGFPVHHQLPELAQTHVPRVGDAIQPFHPLSSASLPAL